ncbi:fasciculation and elongation protein zeta-2-like, partial [Ailuropoda melanoleuca]
PCADNFPKCLRVTGVCVFWKVIEEIEEMMQESPDPEDDETPTQSDRLSMLSQEIQTLQRSSTSSYEERVKRLSVSELNELLEEIETAIKEFSEELVQQLALRDELEFEKEVKNSFISVLIEVQNKQKEHKETAKKKKKLKNGSSQNGKNERSHMPGTVSGVLLGAAPVVVPGLWAGGGQAGPVCVSVQASRGSTDGPLVKENTVLSSCRKVLSW